MKIVLDSNVFISGIFWRDKPHDIIKLAETGKVQICVSNEILDELFGVLQRQKFNYLFEEASISRETVFQKILELVTICAVSERDKNINIALADPKDKMFLSCALASGAVFIVSDDKHLLALKNFRSVPILTSSQFLNKLK